MPYMLDGNCVKKKSGETVKCHETHAEAVDHLRALQMNVKDSAIQELSLFISRASFETNEANPNKRMRFRMSSSDVGRDLADEAMSVELFKSFVERIKTNAPIPEPFRDAICEPDWCGGMPYLSVAHYKAGKGNSNVPGMIEDVYLDGDVLKSKGYCFDTPMGHAAFNSLLDDQQKRKSGVVDFDPVRVSIGFLDLKHKHMPDKGGQMFIFERKSLADICPLCEQGIGGKIYLDGILVHEAMTRVPMNPRTLMVAEDVMTAKSEADDIKTKRDDARSVIGDLADNLVEESLTEKSVLTVKTDVPQDVKNVPSPSEFDECYDPNTGGYDQDCIDRKLAGQMVEDRNEVVSPVKSKTVNKKLLDGVTTSLINLYKSNGLTLPVEVTTMEKQVEKMNLAGTSVPEVPFQYDGVESPPHELGKAPVKSNGEKEPDEDDNKEKEMNMHKSALDESYANLKSLLEKRAGKDEIQNAFNAVAVEVEKVYTPPAQEVGTEVLSAIKELSNMVQTLTLKVATLEAGKSVATPTVGSIPASRALKLQPELPTTSAQAPVRQLSQIQRIARRSTGLLE